MNNQEEEKKYSRLAEELADLRLEVTFQQERVSTLTERVSELESRPPIVVNNG